MAIQGVTSGATGGRVPSKGMLGYVQLSPRGEPISPELFVQLLGEQFGSLGGPVDCVVNMGGSGQLMRVSRVDVNSVGMPGASRSSWSPPAAPPCFPATAHGASSSMTRVPARSRRSMCRPRYRSSGAAAGLQYGDDRRRAE